MQTILVKFFKANIYKIAPNSLCQMESQKYPVLSQHVCDRLYFVRTFLLYCKKRFKDRSHFKKTDDVISVLQHRTHFFIGTFSFLSAVSASLVCAFNKNIVVLVFNCIKLYAM